MSALTDHHSRAQRARGGQAIPTPRLGTTLNSFPAQGALIRRMRNERSSQPSRPASSLSTKYWASTSFARHTHRRIEGRAEPDNIKCHVRKDELRTPSEYENRFNELLQVGYTWLNLSCYGIYESFLIVAVEVPSATVPHATPSGWSPKGEPRTLYPGCATSVNLSGPANIVRDNGWRVDPLLTIE
jgi:hypothetical protein